MNYRIFMPNGGEDGVIVVTRTDGVVVEFRGRPYSMWQIGEDSPMYKLHSSLVQINISQLHCCEIEVVTPWHSEWSIIRDMHEHGSNFVG